MSASRSTSPVAQVVGVTSPCSRAALEYASRGLAGVPLPHPDPRRLLRAAAGSARRRASILGRATVSTTPPPIAQRSPAGGGAGPKPTSAVATGADERHRRRSTSTLATAASRPGAPSPPADPPIDGAGRGHRGRAGICGSPIPGRRSRTRPVGSAPGIDVRGDGGYVIAPPSLHPSGRRYRWARPPGPAADPAGLARGRLPTARSRNRPSRSRCRAGLDAWARAALRGEIDQVRNAVEGTRNVTLNRAAFRLGQLTATGILDETTVTDSPPRRRRRRSGSTITKPIATIRSGITAGQPIPGPRRAG